MSFSSPWSKSYIYIYNILNSLIYIESIFFPIFSSLIQWSIAWPKRGVLPQDGVMIWLDLIIIYWTEERAATSPIIPVLQNRTVGLLLSLHRLFMRSIFLYLLYSYAKLILYYSITYTIKSSYKKATTRQLFLRQYERNNNWRKIRFYLHD